MTWRSASLCMGYGGLDLAVEQVLGTELAWCSENDPTPASIIDARWPDVPNIGDLTTVDWSSLEPIDVLTAGYPVPAVQPRRAAQGRSR